MKLKTYKSKRHAMINSACFECKTKIDFVLPGDVLVIVNRYPYYFHSKCVRQIMSAHIVDALNREAHMQQRASDHKKSDLLAENLGYHRVIREDSEEKGR